MPISSPLDEGQSEDAESPQVVDADSGGLRDRQRPRRRRRPRFGGVDGGACGAAGAAVPRDGGGLGGGGSVGRRRLLLHLAVTLAEIEHLQNN